MKYCQAKVKTPSPKLAVSRGRKIAPQPEKFEKGVTNCEQTINRLLTTEEAYESIASYIAMTRFNNFFGGGNKKGFMMKAAGKFKTYKQEKADQFSGAVKKSKQGEDRLLDDKKFLLKLSKVQTILPSKK